MPTLASSLSSPSSLSSLEACGRILMPTPSGLISGADSYTRELMPARCRARASVNPPMPPPMISTSIIRWRQSDAFDPTIALRRGRLQVAPPSRVWVHIGWFADRLTPSVDVAAVRLVNELLHLVHRNGLRNGMDLFRSEAREANRFAVGEDLG